MKRKLVKRLLWTLLTVFLLLNVVSFMHAYKFTHFTASVTEGAPVAKKSMLGKVKLAFTGIDNPRPATKVKPAMPFETVQLKGSMQFEGWLIKKDSAKGTVILFHGYRGEKSLMLDKAAAFLDMGYNAFLIDFRGSGGSEGDGTTIGFKEAEEVKLAYDYMVQKGEQNIHLFGTSMGAVAIMKAMNDFPLKPSSVLLECPFGTMYQTVCARFKTMGIPAFPMAGLLMFWGGTQNGFWAFGHNPVEYARKIEVPTLLLYGEKDVKVSRQEIDSIYAHLKGPKELVTYPLAGHESYLIQYREKWIKDVSLFLQKRERR